VDAACAEGGEVWWENVPDGGPDGWDEVVGAGKWPEGG